MLRTFNKLYFNLIFDILNGVFAMNQTLRRISDKQLVIVLLYGSQNVIFSTNTKTLSHTIKLLKATERFDSLV